MEAINPLTVREAIKSPSPAMGFLYQDSEIKAAAILTLLITDLVKFFNVGKTMNDFQIGQTIKLIFEDENLRCLKPDDFKLCFTRMKKGHYGKTYDRIDGQIILECLHEYLHERVLEVEQISFSRHEAEKLGNMTKANPEGQKKILQILKSVLKEVPPVAKAEIKKEEKKEIVKSDRDLFIHQCVTEHYNIWLKKEAKDEHGKRLKGRYIEFEGQIVDEIEYTQIKLKEWDLINNKRELGI